MSTKRKRLWRTAFLAACALWTSASLAAEPVKVGTACVDITPPLEMKAALGGYGERQSKPATGVHDRVWAKALVLAQADRKFALVTADVLAFPPQFKAAVMDQLKDRGWTAGQVMLLPSHTHTSMDMMALHPGNVFGNARAGIFHKELHDFAASRLAAGVINAGKALTPATAGSVSVTVPDRNRNRRITIIMVTHEPDMAAYATRIIRFVDGLVASDKPNGGKSS